TPSAKFPCRCPDRTHMSSGRDDFDSLRRAGFAGRAGCGGILQGDDCIFYISVVYWKATEPTLTKGGSNGRDAKDDPPGQALGPVRRAQLGLHPADLRHPAHLLQKARYSAGLTDAEYLAFWGYAASFVTVVVAVLGPTLGAVADLPGMKKKLFAL